MSIRGAAGGLLVLVSITLVADVSTVLAHASGENYVWINVAETHLEGHFEINFVDLKKKLLIEVDLEDPEQSVRSTASAVQEYIQQHFRILAAGVELPYEFTGTGVFGEPPSYARYYYRTPETTVPDTLTIQNDLLFEEDPLHRSLIAMEYNSKTGEEYGEEFATLIFTPANTERELDLLSITGLLDWRAFVWQGVIHIWKGIDHILFLIALLLPAVLVREDKKWRPVASFGAAFWNILKIVTIFTIAHSITLGLAALNLVQVHSRLVESAIAFSIILVGLNTIFPISGKSSWMIIFFFGLFHGLGFASVMSELPFRIVNLISVLLSFNVGVELGQLAIVACVFPLIFLLREQRFYVPVILRCGALAIVLVASYWFVERAFGP